MKTSSVVKYSPYIKPVRSMIGNSNQFIEALEELEHPSNDPKLKRAYQCAIEDVKALWHDYCQFKGD